MKSIVKKIIPFISSIIISLIFTITINADLNFVVDDANLLSSQEETKLRIDLENFKNHLDDSGVLQKLAQIKKDNKERLAKEIYKTILIIMDMVLEKKKVDCYY